MIGAIIAGGRSTRFEGEPKGLLTVGGRRIIDRVAFALREVCSEVILVSSIPGAAEWLPGVQVVPDNWVTRGSLVGVHAALRHTNEPTLIVAWDMPFVAAEVLRLLCERSTHSHFATVPVLGGQFEPFCAVYTPKCLPWIEAALDANEMRLTRVLESLPELERVTEAELAPMGNPRTIFFNVNDAAGLSQARGLCEDASGSPLNQL